MPLPALALGPPLASGDGIIPMLISKVTIRTRYKPVKWQVAATWPTYGVFPIPVSEPDAA